jgi:hypothetical protein
MPAIPADPIITSNRRKAALIAALLALAEVKK